MKKARLLNSPAAVQDKIKLIPGLAYAYNRSTEAIALFDGLKNSDDDFVKYAANINAAVLSGKMPATNEAVSCQIAFETDALVDNVKLHRPATAAWTMLDNTAQIEISTVLNPISELLVFRVSGQNRLSLQRIHGTGAAPAPGTALRRNAVATSRGYIEVCREKRVALLVSDSRNKTLEWAKFYEFR
jgi:hypothetical protein